jgi:hypothetical protein
LVLDFFLVDDDFLAGVVEEAGSSAIGAADAMVLPTKPTAAKRAVAVRRMRLVMADTVFSFWVSVNPAGQWAWPGQLGVLYAVETDGV